MLTLQNSWYEDGHHFVRWRPVSQVLLLAAKLSLGKHLKSYLSLRCTHVKGRGGAKASVRFAQMMAAQYYYTYGIPRQANITHFADRGRV